MEIALHRHVEDLVGQYDGLIAADVLERQKTEGSLVFEGYKALEDRYREALETSHYTKIYEMVKANPLPAISPKFINRFLQATVGFESHPHYTEHTGIFLSQLMITSYAAGFNGFLLDMRSIERIDNIGNRLEGTKANPVRIRSKGTAGNWFCSYAHHIEINADNIGDYAIYDSRYATLNAKMIGETCADKVEHGTVNARTIGSVGMEAEDLDVHAKRIKGYAINKCDNSRVTADFMGKCTGVGSRNCEYRTTRMSTARTIEFYLSKDQGNKVYFVNKDGTEALVCSDAIWRKKQEEYLKSPAAMKNLLKMLKNLHKI